LAGRLSLFEENLRIMQVRPRGQKKPGQHGLQFTALDGTDPSSDDSSPNMQAQPGWHPSAHEFLLQFLLTLEMLRLLVLAKLLMYTSNSSLLHNMAVMFPAQTNLFTE
jgi:hypothetical protein